MAVFNSQTSISIQKQHRCTGNLNSEAPGDSKNAFLRQGDVLALCVHAGHGYLGTEYLDPRAATTA
jgi:hypothetical protein